MNDFFPDLQIIATSKAVLHEEIDPSRVERLKRVIIKDSFMLNPIMTTRLKNGKYLVLDGANRLIVFKQLRIPSILAQGVPYKKPFVDLKTWNHLVCDTRFRKHCRSKFKRFKTHHAQAMLDFVSLYKGRFRFHRVADDSFSLLKKQYKNATCLVIFPKFRPREIASFALNEQKIPAGITRHLIKGRALRLRVPLKILKSKSSLLNKNKWLKNHIAGLGERNKVRYYAEPVFLFDE